MKLNTKIRIRNGLIKNGNSVTCEKLINKSLKLIQKKTIKNSTVVIKNSIVKSAPLFKINQQHLKKGKRKVIRTVPTFIQTRQTRLMLSIKNLRRIFLLKDVSQSKSFIAKLSQEILYLSLSKNSISNRQINIHKQAVENKRYLTKFQW